ncbi:MAG: hypothetical protein N3E45_08655 [Oscillatoriaceae bacterium SKW80]|nr:hypothetical protein [Oscillatoriaceae bacterium SKYG93]MCX8120889.1 hypothetical protein [Oscillatoriaceae bacterium SKW80]MDW8452162.1 hypothetical protein [Oscillatoriaceae cyanobacterium SKYGB_i_bin93]
MNKNSISISARHIGLNHPPLIIIASFKNTDLSLISLPVQANP